MVTMTMKEKEREIEQTKEGNKAQGKRKERRKNDRVTCQLEKGR